MIGTVITAAGAMAEYAAEHCEGTLSGALRATGVVVHLAALRSFGPFQTLVGRITGSSLPECQTSEERVDADAPFAAR